MSAEQLVAELVSIDSVNPDLVRPDGVRGRDRRLRGRLAGARAWRSTGSRAPPDGRAWLRWRPPRGGGASLMLNAHMTPSGWRA